MGDERGRRARHVTATGRQAAEQRRAGHKRATKLAREGRQTSRDAKPERSNADSRARREAETGERRIARGPWGTRAWKATHACCRSATVGRKWARNA